MTGGASRTWIDDGEKYGLVGLSVKFEGSLPPGKLTTNLSVLADTKFNVPSNWREWLGSIRAGEVEDCNLFLVSKLVSAAPGVRDGENQKLQQRVWNFYVGLLLASTFAPAHKPVMLTARAGTGRSTCASSRTLTRRYPACFGRIRRSGLMISGLQPVSGRI